MLLCFVNNNFFVLTFFFGTVSFSGVLIESRRKYIEYGRILAKYPVISTELGVANPDLMESLFPRSQDDGFLLVKISDADQLIKGFDPASIDVSTALFNQSPGGTAGGCQADDVKYLIGRNTGL